MSRYLYHATYEKNIQGIRQNGILGGQGLCQNWKSDGMTCWTDPLVFLAFNPDTAESYAETAPDGDSDHIKILAVDPEKLDPMLFEYDWNVKCENISDIDTIAYNGNIPVSAVLWNLPCDSTADSRIITNLKNYLIDFFEENVET